MVLDEASILMNQSVKSKDEAIELAGKLLVEQGVVEPDYIQSMFDRDTLVSTYIGNNIAIPHGTDEGRQYIKRTGLSFVQIPDGVDFSENAGEKVAKIIIGIAGMGDEHLELLSNIAIICSETDNVERLIRAQDPKEIIDILTTEVL